MQYKLFPKHHSRYFHFAYLLDALSQTQGKFLDVGCGWGALAAQLKTAREDLVITACDKNPEYITRCKKFFGGSKIDWIVSGVEKLPFGDEEFNAVALTDVLEHLSGPEDTLREISRVMVKGGIFYLVVPLEAEAYTFDFWIKRFFNFNLKEKPIGHIQQFRLTRIKTILNRAGFQIVKLRFSYHFFYQFLSLSYYLFINFFNRGKYKTFPSISEDVFMSGSVQFLNKLAGWLVYSESKLMSKIPGGTAYITAVKR